MNNSLRSVQRIFDHRAKDSKIEFLVKWEGYPESENTWRQLNFIQKEWPRHLKKYLDQKDLKLAKWIDGEYVILPKDAEVPKL